MKKITTLFALLVFSGLLFCQNISPEHIFIEKKGEITLPEGQLRGTTTDTIYDYIERATGFLIYTLEDTSGNFAGYLAGTNGSYSEFGMVMSRTLSATETMELNTLIFLVYKKEIMGGSADNVSFNVFNTSAGLPTGSAIGSTTISVDILDTASATQRM